MSGAPCRGSAGGGDEAKKAELGDHSLIVIPAKAGIQLFNPNIHTLLEFRIKLP
jgi:hypothetical protein